MLIFSIFQIFLLVKGIFCPAETYFSADFSFRIVDMYFKSCGNRFLLFNLFFFYKWKPSLKLVETNLFGKDYVPIEKDFAPSGNCFLLYRASFYKWKPLLKLVEIELNWIEFKLAQIYIKT